MDKDDFTFNDDQYLLDTDFDDESDSEEYTIENESYD